jgi:hypothetical protein
MMNYGDGKLDAIQPIGPITLSDTTQACLALQWSGMPVRGDKQTVQRIRATATIDADGATGSKVLLTLTVERQDFTGTAIADLTYVISGAAAKVDWSDVSASDTASAATLKDLIDLINQIEGFKAWALHAPHDMSLNSGNFIDLAETPIKSGVGPEGRSDILQRDVSAFAIDTDKQVLWARISLPEERDANAFYLHLIQGAQTGATGGLVQLYRDQYGQSDTEAVYVKETAVATTRTKYADYTIENAPTLRGPCILEVSASDLTAAEFLVNIRQASVGM